MAAKGKKQQQQRPPQSVGRTPDGGVSDIPVESSGAPSGAITSTDAASVAPLAAASVATLPTAAAPSVGAWLAELLDRRRQVGEVLRTVAASRAVGLSIGGVKTALAVRHLEGMPW